MVSKRCVVLYAALALGAILVILGALALTLVPSIIRSQVVQRDFLGYDDVNETKLNEMTEQWLVPPYAMQIQIWLYSLSNKNETLDGGKPRLQEIGPFTFTEKQEKTSYRFTHNNTRILYRNMHYYYFNRNLSVSDLSAQVLIPNIVYQKILDFSTNASPFLVEALEFLLREIKYDSPFIQVSVGDALFNGYKDPLIDKICSYALLKPLCADVLKVPDRIGFFNTVNATDDGEYEVDTGLANPLNIGHVYSWNNQTSLDKCWSSHFAAMINGSDGQLFPPLLQKDQTVTLFASQIFRSVNMVAADDSVYAGIPTLRFRSPANANDPSIPDNQGFCNKNATPTFFNKSVQIPGCLPAGLLDFGRCQPSSPRVYLSQAHFLNSPREVRDVFESYPEPLEDNDDTFVDIEPTSGVPLHAKKVMQINIGMITGKLRATAKMHNMIMPLLWINETVYADEGTLKQLGGMVAIRHYAFLGGIAALTLGSIFFVAFISIFVVHTYCQNRTEESELLINEEEHHARTDGDDEVPFD